MKKMNTNRAQHVAWALVGMTIAGILFNMAFWMRSLTGRPDLGELVDAFGWIVVIPLTFALLAALIISREPGNRVGWLMMIVALAAANPVHTILEPLGDPEVLTSGLFILVWMGGWSWTPVMFPIFLIPLLFPAAGHPPHAGIGSSIWRWACGSSLWLSPPSSMRSKLPTATGPW